jgi:hypothetical protein
MSLFQGLLFLILGVGLLIMDYRSLSTGWLPYGPKGLSGRLELRKDQQPLVFWLLFVLYAVAGIALATFALRLLVGIATPLPFR